MLTTFTVTDAFDYEITAAHNNIKVTLLDMGLWVNNLKAEFPGINLNISAKLEQLDLTYSLPGLTECPFPPLGDLETRAERSTALLKQWRDYPSLGLGIFTSQKLFWVKAGVLPLQNHAMENWQPLLVPFLTTASEVFLLGKNTRIAIEVIDLGHGLLKNNDRLTIRGGFTVNVTAWEKERENIQQRRSYGVDLLDGVASLILPYNPNRKYIYLTNAGSSFVQFCFGTPEDLSFNALIENNKIIRTNGLLLTPFGSANFESNYYIEASPLSAVSIGGNGRLTLIEGE